MSASLAIRPTLYEELVPGGGHTSFILKRGQLLRLTDLEGGANVSLLMFNAYEKSERLNLPDTLKCQHTAKLTAGQLGPESPSVDWLGPGIVCVIMFRVCRKSCLWGRE